MGINIFDGDDVEVVSIGVVVVVYDGIDGKIEGYFKFVIGGIMFVKREEVSILYDLVFCECLVCLVGGFCVGSC